MAIIESGVPKTEGIIKGAGPARRKGREDESARLNRAVPGAGVKGLGFERMVKHYDLVDDPLDLSVDSLPVTAGEPLTDSESNRTDGNGPLPAATNRPTVLSNVVK